VRQQFAQQCFEQWAASDVKYTKEREALHSKVSALQDFIAHMNAYVHQKDEIIKSQAPSSEEDAPEESD
jgi:hypothetical protein